MQNSSNASVAKIVLLSVIATLITLCSLLYIFRVEVSELVYSSIESELANLDFEFPEYATNEDIVVGVIAAANPAVVSIVVTKEVPVYEQYYEEFDVFGWFDSFSIPRVRENGTEEREVGGGSGFFVSSDGLIVTNRHVVADETASYSAILSNGLRYDLEVIDRDSQLDIAVLKLAKAPKEAISYLSFNTDTLKLGQTVIAIGNALAEFQNSISVGVVSGIGRSVVASDAYGNSERLDQVIQTDAAINPGNSGGPLLNLSGKVVGVNVATSRGADNIGFALPAHVVSQVVASVKEYGEIKRPFLGVRYVMLDQTDEYPAIQSEYGALLDSGDSSISAVEPGSPAATAGLQNMDVIIAINGVSLEGRDLANVLRDYLVGDEIILRLVRDNQQFETKITLVEAL